MAEAITLLLAAVTAGAFIFTILSLEASRRYMSAPLPATEDLPPISVLKPLAGIDQGLEENLRSFFEQDYPRFEILMAVSTESDPALAVARRFIELYPAIPARVLVTGEPSYPNRKVCSVDRMVKTAAHELLVMSDSDIRVTRPMLRAIAAEFQDPRLALTTCPYRAVGGPGIWSRIEAVMMNTEFLSGILVARMLEGMRFAVGPTTVARRGMIEAIGGFESLRDYLAEDFVLGQRAAEMGFGVGLSRYVVEHRIGSSGFRANANHRLRWVRSTRRSRPAGYVGQLFTYPLPVALALLCWAPAWWPLAVAALAARAVSAWIVGARILKARDLWLVPVQDLMSLGFWLAGFFGNTITWRGNRFHLERDGRFRRL